MSKPLIHAKASVHKFGGVVEDYMEIHEFFDQTKAHVPDFRHRAVLHNSFGIYLCQQVFGYYFTNSAGKDVSVRDVAEQHVIDDLGFIPTLDKCFENMPQDAWLSGRVRRRKSIQLKDVKALNVMDKPESPTPAALKEVLDVRDSRFIDGSRPPNRDMGEYLD